MAIDPSTGGPTVAPAALSIPDSGRYLGLSRGTIYNLVKRGELRRVKVGRRSLIARQDLDAFLQAHGDSARAS